MGCVLVHFSIAAKKHLYQKKVGGRVYSRINGSQGSNLKAGTGADAMEDCCLEA